MAILAATAIGLAASGIASYLVQRQRVLASVDEQLLQTVVELKAVASEADSSTTPDTVETVLRAAMQQLVPSPDESVLGLIDGSPALIPSISLPFRIDADPLLLKRITAEAHPTNVVMGTAHSTAGTLRYIIIPVSFDDDPHEGLYVAAINLDAVLTDVLDSFGTFLVVALIALLLIGLVVWFVAGRLLRPIRLLRRAAAANTAMNLSGRIPVTGRDDLSELTETINRMFERLEEAFSSQRRLIDDVGHELKTPITIIRGHLELLDSEKRDDVDAVKALAIDELDRMSVLVSQISLLAESGTPQFIDRHETDLDALTSAVVTKASALDPAREWVVESRATGTALVDTGRLTQAWLQLAGNAAKYSTEGTTISLGSRRETTRTGEWLLLFVRDVGPGIPVDAQGEIFERFHRLEASRGSDGSGLGLAIVSAIAAAHGGTVTLASAEGEGSLFTIRIPIEPSPQEDEDGQ
ncbi:MAG TPA: HAMP domain-containing sensor histidine kinase [Terrimesophilobacter sp.]|nr:HAMP domain-containing sensor histidine kinase [Terrimesophilobacter sp.]